MPDTLLRYGVCLTLLQLTLSVEASGWGFRAHREITRRSIDILPPTPRQFFEAHREYLVRHCVDPDLIQKTDSLEQFNHYLDFDYYGEFPFVELPHRYEDAVQKFSADTLMRYGLLPWKIDEYTHRLTMAMREGDEGEILHAAIYLAHYVEDANVPLHAALNYDGQMTNQSGIHSRFESGVPERYMDDYRYTFPGTLSIVQNPLEHAFATLRESFTLVDMVLEADLSAKAAVPADSLFVVLKEEGHDRTRYSDRYFEVFNSYLNDLPRRRMERSMVEVARYWYTAWVTAGRPSLPKQGTGDR